MILGCVPNKCTKSCHTNFSTSSREEYKLMAERLLSTKTVHQKNDQNNAHNAKEEGRFPMEGTIQDIETPEFERKLSASLARLFSSAYSAKVHQTTG